VEDSLIVAKFSPDSRWLATGGATMLRLWEVESGAPHGSAMLPRDAISDFTFSPDGRQIVTMCADRTNRVWDIATGRPISPFLPSGSNKNCFTSDSDFLLTDTSFGVLRLWDLKPAAESRALPESAGRIRLLARGPLGGVALFSVGANSARVWNIGAHRFVSPPLSDQGSVFCADFSPDERFVATGAGNGAQIWEVATGRAVTTFLEHDGRVVRVSFSANGRILVTLASDSQKGLKARLWDASSGQAICPSLPHNLPAIPLPLASPDGRIVVAFQEPRHLHVFDAANLKELTGPLEGSNPTFNPDGKRFAYTDFRTGDVRLLETDGWRPVGEMLQKPGYSSQHFEFSRTLDRLVSIDEGQDGRGLLLVWDARSGARIVVIESETASTYFRHASFSPDGERVVSVDQRNSFQVWDAGTGAPVTPPVRLLQTLARATFSDDGRRIITFSGTNAARQFVQEWDAASGEPVTLSRRWIRNTPQSLENLEGMSGSSPLESVAASLQVDELMMLAKLLSLHYVGARGGILNISPTEADRLWQELTVACPSAFFRPDLAAKVSETAKKRAEYVQAAAEAESSVRIPEAIAADAGHRLAVDLLSREARLLVEAKE
jgi:WD40 repeat protein